LQVRVRDKIFSVSLRTVGFVEEQFIQSPPSQIFLQLSEPARMIGLQPLLVACEVVNRSVDADSQTAAYEVFYIERFKLLGPLHYDNRIHTFIKTHPSENRVTFSVRSFPRIELTSSYQLTARESGTHVALSVTVESPGILASFVCKIAQAAHRKLLENLKRRCEGPEKSWMSESVESLKQRAT
jgi:hypothetical protein